MKSKMLCFALISLGFLLDVSAVDQKANQSSDESIYSKDIWMQESYKIKEIFAAQNNSLDLKTALNIVRQRIFGISEDQEIDIYNVFDEIRSEYSKEAWSDEDILRFIDDALEIKKKYPIFLNFVIRSKYAKKAVQEGIDAAEVLALSSSEYIHLPRFILRKVIKAKDLNKVLSDLGVGVVWKDRMKYLYVSRKFKDNENHRIVNKLDNCPKHVYQYFQLIDEISKLFEDADTHIRYVIAQDFFFDNLPKEKIVKIFSLTEKEWKSLIKPEHEY